jgi:hypothetical protein
MKVTRRRFLAASAAAGASGLWLWFGGRPHVSKVVRSRLHVLSARRFAVLRALLATSLGPRRVARAGSLDDLTLTAETFLSTMPARLREQVGHLLDVLEHFGPARAGHLGRFSRLDASEQADCYARWQNSRSRVLAGGTQAIKALAMFAYYRRAESYRELGFPGPQVPRDWPGPATQSMYESLLARR